MDGIVLEAREGGVLARGGGSPQVEKQRFIG